MLKNYYEENALYTVVCFMKEDDKIFGLYGQRTVEYCFFHRGTKIIGEIKIIFPYEKRESECIVRLDSNLEKDGYDAPYIETAHGYAIRELWQWAREEFSKF